MRRGVRRLMHGLALGTGLASVVTSCGFPDYKPGWLFGGGGTAGKSGGSDAGAAGEGAQGAQGAQGGASNVGGSGGTSGDGPGLAGQGGEGGEIPIDIGACGQRPHPLHCLNHVQDIDETDVDCGGPRCSPCAADEACVADRDCTSGTCETESNTCTRLFTLQYVRQIDQTSSAAFHFRAVLTYHGAEPQLMSDVTLRYYFSRNDVAEPILPSSTAFQQPGNINIGGKVSVQIVRLLRGNSISNDAYLELGFQEKSSLILLQNGELELEGIATTGDGASLFNQQTHYSFDQETSLHESKHLVVYLKGKRAWGSPPPVEDPPSCFHLGVNLDGAAINRAGQDPWLASPASVLARYIDDQVVLYPATDRSREDMLRAGFFFHNDSFTYATDNGEYELLAYAWSAAGSESGRLQVQGIERDKFQATSWNGASPWVALGPYRITIDDGQLTLGATDDLRLGGFELRLLDEK